MIKDSATIKWMKPVATVRKYDDDGNLLEEITSEGNLLLTAGLDKLMKRWSLTSGYAALNEAAIRLGVGDDNTTEALTDVDLSTTTNQYYKALSGAPSQVNGSITYVASFGASDANFAWNCWGIDYLPAGGSPASSSTPNGLINRKVASFGTKSGGTWTFTVTITLA